MKIVSSAVLGLFLAACASSSSSPSSTDTSDIHGGTICPPLDYPHVMSNDQFYRQFASDDAAAAYMTALVTSGQLASTSGADATFKEVSHDPRLLGLLDEVYAGFRKVYPAATEGLPTAPRIVIVESSQVNAFALGPGFVDTPDARTDQSPWVFIVHTALLNRPASDTALRGLFAHELGHLVLRNLLPDVRRAIRSVYAVRGSEDGVLGENQNDDPSLAAHVDEIQKRTARVGALPRLGLPLLIDAGSYTKVMKQLVKAAVSLGTAPSAACTTARESAATLVELQGTFLPNASGGDLTPRVPSADESAKLDALSATTADALRSCVAPLTDPEAKSSLAQLVAALDQIPPEAADPTHPDHAKLVALMLDAETKVDASSTATSSLMDRVLRAEGPVRSELASLQDDPQHPIDEIRVYDVEEDADDAAVRVLGAIGDSPTGIGDFLLDNLLDAPAKAACLADIATGRAVPYGRFIDEHPVTCWRYYHVTQMAKALLQCAPTPANETRAPRGSGQPSAADKAPKDLVEKGYGPGTR